MVIDNMRNGCLLQEAKYQDFDALVLGNELTKVCVVPELGGKITSIQHVPTQREWLWRNPYIQAQPVVYDASFVEIYDTGGLDECFPAVAGETYPDDPWKGSLIPDHGELWCQPWDVRVIESSTKKIALGMGCHGVRFPYRFERMLTISSQSANIRLDYSVTNFSNFVMPFVWSIHPILNIEEGMRVVLPAGVKRVRIDSTTYRDLGEEGDQLDWPLAKIAEHQSLDLSRVRAKGYGQAHKLYSLPIIAGEMVETALVDKDGAHSFTFRFGADEITHVGVWMNFGGWSGSGSEHYYNLGLEPCIGGRDSLLNAKQLEEYAFLPAKGSRNWSLELSIR
jgi:galactose mutarotase-like enzyme